MHPFLYPKFLLQCEYNIPLKVDEKTLKDKIHGAWIGRIVGCMLGKTVEGIKSEGLTPLLKETNNYPMHRYILKSDITDEICGKYNFPLNVISITCLIRNLLAPVV